MLTDTLLYSLLSILWLSHGLRHVCTAASTTDISTVRTDPPCPRTWCRLSGWRRRWPRPRCSKAAASTGWSLCHRCRHCCERLALLAWRNVNSGMRCIEMAIVYQTQIYIAKHLCKRNWIGLLWMFVTTFGVLSHCFRFYKSCLFQVGELFVSTISVLVISELRSDLFSPGRFSWPLPVRSLTYSR